MWVVTSPLQSFFGLLVGRSGSYDLGLAIAGLAPWIGVVAMRFLWRIEAVPVAPDLIHQNVNCHETEKRREVG